MIKLYVFGESRSRRVLWAAEEVGAAYEPVFLTQWPPRLHHPEYLTVNPSGSVPAMVDGEVVLTESLVICEYLSRRSGGTLTVEPGGPDYFGYLQHLHYGEGTLAPPLGWARRLGPLSDTVMAEARSAFSVRLAVVETALADGREFLAADRFTLADISVAYALGLSRLSGLDDLIPPAVAAYRDRMFRRPACLRAYAV